MAELKALEFKIDTSEIVELLQRLVAATERGEVLLRELSRGNDIAIPCEDRVISYPSLDSKLKYQADIT